MHFAPYLSLIPQPIHFYCRVIVHFRDVPQLICHLLVVLKFWQYGQNYPCGACYVNKVWSTGSYNSYISNSAGNCQNGGRGANSLSLCPINMRTRFGPQNPCENVPSVHLESQCYGENAPHVCAPLVCLCWVSRDEMIPGACWPASRFQWWTPNQWETSPQRR